MDKTVDCFFIGHNEMSFSAYEPEVRKMGTHSGAYRDLNLNFIQYNNKPYTASDIFNLFYLSQESAQTLKPLNLDENFSSAIAYLGTYLQRRGYSFDFVNTFQAHKEKLARRLQAGNIRLIAVTTTLYVSVFPILEIMEFIRAHNSEVKVVLGGPFVSNQCRTMDPASLEYIFKLIGADFYVNSSQGEAALVKILESLKAGTAPQGIPNIHYKSGAGYTVAPLEPENNDLSENMVDWRLFSKEAGQFVGARTAISCPFACAFCGFPEHAGTYRTANTAAVEEEFNRLNGLGTVQSVNIIDDTFNVPVKRFKEILRMMIKNRYNFRWNSHFRCQFADREAVELMKESGCEGVFLGIESGSDRILKNMNKKAVIQHYLNGIQLLKEMDIMTYGSFIIGFPGETEETVAETLHFIKEGGLDFFRAQLWYCDTVTPIWQQRDKYGISGSNFEWRHNDMDNKQASDIVEDIFLNVHTPTWVPQYNFECDGLFHLIHRGFDRNRIKTFLEAFNRGVRDKVRQGGEISSEVVMSLKQACMIDPAKAHAQLPQSKIDRSQVDFDF